MNTSSDAMMTEKNPFVAERRQRRLRSHPALRDLVRENRVTPQDLVHALFAVPGSGIRKEVKSMPGVFQESIDSIEETARELEQEGIAGVMVFGIPEKKDPTGAVSLDPDGIVPQAMEAIAKGGPSVLRIADLCFCEYTDHGHCGVLDAAGNVRNDPTIESLAEQARVLADAGSQVIAPSGMMDGMVAAIRAGLDAGGHQEIPILSYAAKYASAFYGPFRDAADSAPAFGDRRAYQMDPANGDEAIREVAQDLKEGADMVMVKPGMPYLDILRRVKRRFGVPTATYQVSGEYAMIKAAAEKGWIDHDRVVDESLLAFKRAGADFIISYFSRDFARRYVGRA